MKVHDGSRRFMTVHKSSGWVLLVNDGSRLFMMVLLLSLLLLSFSFIFFLLAVSVFVVGGFEDKYIDITISRCLEIF